ncbi:hypothetical protein [Desulfolucanica intricata]|nr:hypothetical protein [Desulfolucanica intricata]
MNKVLIATVGGSIEPIVTSIIQNRPDFTISFALMTHKLLKIRVAI